MKRAAPLREYRVYGPRLKRDKIGSLRPIFRNFDTPDLLWIAREAIDEALARNPHLERPKLTLVPKGRTLR